MSVIQRHYRLGVVLLLYLLLATAYSISLPLGRGADEYAHFQYVRFITENHRLPLSWSEREQNGYKAEHPPFYHLFPGVLFSGVETTGQQFKQIRFGEDHRLALLYEVLGDQKWIIPTEINRFPYLGLARLWHLSRLVSVVFGVAIIVVTYATALQLWPHHPNRAVLASWLLLFWPRFMIGASIVGDDVMVSLLLACYLWLILRLAQGDLRQRNFLLIGLCLGLGMLTKYTTGQAALFTLPIFCVLAWWYRWPLSYLFKQSVLVVSISVLLYSLWAGFVLWNFNQIAESGWLVGIINPLVPNVVAGVTGGNLVTMLQEGAFTPAPPPNFDSMAWVSNFVLSFSMIVNEEVILLPQPVALVGLGGLFLLISVGVGRAWWQASPLPRLLLILIGVHFFSFFLFVLIRSTLTPNIPETAQGRHVFMPAASAIALLLTIGWLNWTRPRYRRWLYPLLPAVGMLWTVGQLYWTNHATLEPLPVAINPIAERPLTVQLQQSLFDDAFALHGYHLDPPHEGQLPLLLAWRANFNPISKDYLSHARLLNHAGKVVSIASLHPANGRYPQRAWYGDDLIYDTLHLPLYGLPAGTYTVQATLLEAYQNPTTPATEILFSAPVTLTAQPAAPPVWREQLTVDIAGEVAQFSFHLPPNPWPGIRPTWHHRAALPVVWAIEPPELASQLQLHMLAPDGTAYAPLTVVDESCPASCQPQGAATFIVAADWPSGPYRLQLTVGNQQQHSRPLFNVETMPRQFQPPAEVSRPVAANFYHHISMVGYELPRTRLQPGEPLSLFVTWRSLQTVNGTLRVFNHLYDHHGTLQASYSHIPPPFFGSTILWVPGQYIRDGYTIPTEPTIPEGVYTLHTGLFLGLDSAIHLPLIIDGQPSTLTHVELGPIKIGRGPAEFLPETVQPTFPRNDILGESIQLQGVDLSHIESQTDQLTLRFYWHMLAPTTENYTVFVHLVDAHGDLLAQTDAPPTGGIFPTSLWDVGQTIADELTLTLPPTLNPTADHHLRVGLYNPETGLRLPLTSPSESPSDSITLPLSELLSP